MKWQEWSEVAEDESRWIHNNEKGLLKAEHLHDFVLSLWFQDELAVSVYELDFRPLVVDGNPGGVFESLRDVERFKNVRGDYALIWFPSDANESDQNVVDIAPECVRFFCEKYGKLIETLRGERLPELIH